MPWHIGSSAKCPASKPHAVIKNSDSSVAGCHATEEDAKKQLAALYASEPKGHPLLHKTFDLIETKADGEAGQFTALASVFGNVDHVGDRVMPGAFKATLERWRESGDPIPVVLSHQWDNPMAHIGIADPRAVVETERGLLVQGKRDIGDNETAKQVHKLMKRRSLKSFSFGYVVPDGGEELAKDGANNLTEVDLVEFGPTLKGANPEAALQSVKSALDQEAPVEEGEILDSRKFTVEEVAKVYGVPPDEVVKRVEEKAEWSTSYINDLPDSSFLYVESGGSKDSDGKTTPRSLRHFPVKDSSGNVDMAHVKNALSRIPQSNVSDSVKQRCIAVAQRLLDAAKSFPVPEKVETVESEKSESPPAEPAAKDPLKNEIDRALIEIALDR
jgi:Escherichia/Staphylococcus phage prohead protease